MGFGLINCMHTEKNNNGKQNKLRHPCWPLYGQFVKTVVFLYILVAMNFSDVSLLTHSLTFDFTWWIFLACYSEIRL